MDDAETTRQASGTQPGAANSQPPWQRLKGSVDLREPHHEPTTHVGGVDSQGNEIGVKVSRNSGPADQVIWTKTIHPQHRELAGLRDWEVSTMTFLYDLVDGRRPNNLGGYVVGIPAITRKRHAPGDPSQHASTSMILQGRDEKSSEVTTQHAGVTLDRLLACQAPRLSDGRRLPHVLVEPANLLALIRQVLSAMDRLAAHHVQHCDLALRNIAIPCLTECVDDPDDGLGYRLYLDWGKAKLIDFGLSCRCAIAPTVPLPRVADDASISHRLRSMVVACGVWQADQQELLECFKGLDWREDAYQFGYALRGFLRCHGVGQLAGSRDAGLLHTLLWGDGSAGRQGLVPSMLAWGGADQCRPLPGEVLRPHRAWLQQIDDLTGQLAGTGGQARPVTFFQADTDAAYRAQFSLLRNQRRAMALANQADLAEAQRRHAQATATLDIGKARLEADKASFKQDQQALQQQQAGLDQQAE